MCPPPPVFTCCLSSALFDVQEYKRKQIEEQRQAERLQRQLQQERAYLVSLQQQQEPPRPPQDKKQLYHYKDQAPSSNDKPSWAKEVPETPQHTQTKGKKSPENKFFYLQTSLLSFLSRLFSRKNIGFTDSRVAKQTFKNISHLYWNRLKISYFAEENKLW